MGSLKGKLLVAGAALFDPHFRRAVVLVTEHDDDGALGLVLNRPAETTVNEAVPGLAPLVPDDAPVFVGGPVDQHSVLVVAEFEDPDESAATIFENVGFVRGDTEIDVAAEVTGRARVFAGYAGWGPGQLDAELEREDVFGDEDEELWSSVLRRQGRSYFALLATMPIDPSMN